MSNDPTAQPEPTEAERERAQHHLAETLRMLLARPTEHADRACPACGDSGTPREPRSHPCMFSGEELHRVECQACGLIFGPFALIDATPEELGRCYELLYAGWSEGDSRFAQEKTFYLMNPSRTKRYINYACGDWAQGVAHLRDLGWNVVGFEPFQDNASPHIARSAIDPLLEPSDGVFTHNYLEHIQDPDAFIRDCLRFLTPDGTMAHSTPCYEYRFAQSPFHLYFFCGNSMDRLVQRHGFRQTHRVTSDNTPQTIGMAYEFRAFARDRASAPSELAP